MRTVPVDTDPSHRVDPRYKHKLAATPREGVETLYDLAKDAFARYGSVRCMGSRVFQGWDVPGKVKRYSETITWRTFSDVNVEAHQFGAALRSAGLQPAPYSTTLDRVTIPCRMAIFENTCPEWMIAAMGVGIAYAALAPGEQQTRLVVGGLIVPVAWGACMAWTLADNRILRATAVLVGVALVSFTAAIVKGFA